MQTPAAKKRRVDAANATLKKPFRSPLINRSKSDAAAISRPSTPLNQVESFNEAGGILTAASPERAHKPVKLQPSAISADGSPHRASEADLSSLITELEKELEKVAQPPESNDELLEQATKITHQSHSKRPREEADNKLRELIGKWKRASQLAAEQVFEIAKERVSSNGGTKALKEARRRQQEFLSGFNEKSPKKKPVSASDDELSSQGSQVYEAGSSQELAVPEEPEDDEEEAEEEFTMSIMLRTLNIDPDILGYDEAQDRWRD